MTNFENPFLERGPVLEPAQFFGRRGEVRKLVQALGARVPQSISLIGERRVGKTSLFNYLAAPGGAFSEFSHLLSRKPEEYLFVRADLSALKTDELNNRLFLFRLLLKNLDKAVREKLGRGFPALEQYWDNKSLSELVEFGLGGYLDDLRRAAPNLAVLFLLDEADGLIRQGVGALLRSLIQDRPLAFALATRLPLVEIDPERELSPLYTMIAETIALGLLPEAEIRQLLTAQAGEAFTPAEVDLIVRLGGLHPDFTRVAAKRIWQARELARGEVPAPETRAQIAADLEPSFRNLWEGLSPEDQALCLELALTSEPLVLGTGGQILKRKGLLNAQNSFFSPLFADFLRQQAPVKAPVASGELRFGDGFAAQGELVVKLSPTELKLLQYLAGRPGEVCTREEIHVAVWGEPYTENDTVKINITLQRMKQKLGALAGPIEAVRGLGYRWNLKVD